MEVVNEVNFGLESAVAGGMKKELDQAGFKRWYNNSYSKVVNLGVGDMDALSYVTKQMSDPNLTPLQRTALQQLVELRSQIASAISQMLRIMSETARAIIQNIR